MLETSKGAEQQLEEITKIDPMSNDRNSKTEAN
jgi:hypothetical protein